MPRIRTPIPELKLQASPNLRRALKREQNAPEIQPGDADEIEKLNVLIEKTLVECAKGAVLGRKSKGNPAFRSLQILIACREMLRGRSAHRDPDGDPADAEGGNQGCQPARFATYTRE
jgi:hypothetical protein